MTKEEVKDIIKKFSDNSQINEDDLDWIATAISDVSHAEKYGAVLNYP